MQKTVMVITAILFIFGCSQPPEMPAPEPAASQPTLDQLKSRADQLLSQMASEDYKAREKATRALCKLFKSVSKQSGKWKAVVGYVEKKSAETIDPEVAFRLNALLKPLRPRLCYRKYRKIHILSGHSGKIYLVAFSPDGKLLASASSDKTIRIWDTHTGKCCHTLRGHTDEVISVVFSPDGTWLLSASSDGTVRKWRPRKDEGSKILRESNEALLSVLVSPDGRVVAHTGVNNITYVSSFETGVFIRSFEGGLLSAAFSPDGSLLATADNRDAIRIWNIEAHKCLQTLRQRTGLITSVVFNRDSKLLAVSNGVSFDNAKIRVWDVQNGNCLNSMEYEEKEISSVVFVQNTDLLASGGSGKVVKVWDVNSGECIDVLTGHTKYITSAASSPDGKLLASGSTDKTVIIWGIPEE